MCRLTKDRGGCGVDAAVLSDANLETRKAMASVIAEVAVSGGPPSPTMRATFGAVVRTLGLTVADAEDLLQAALEMQATADLPAVASVWEATPAATRGELDAAYVREITRYDPVAMSEFGAELAALAVHRLSDITLLYEMEVGRLEAEAKK